MKMVMVYHYDAFSSVPNKGNPAGVVLDAEGLSDEEMQRIAEKVGFSETAFVLSSTVADLRIRYFTPGNEVDLCGHATVATLYSLKTNGLLQDKENILVETKAGILPMSFTYEKDNAPYIVMQQLDAAFKEFEGSIEQLMNVIGLNRNSYNDDLPILYGSTGLWSLFVPIRTLNDFSKMNPKNEEFSKVLDNQITDSIHLFCLETVNRDATLHGRHFSSPQSGIIEDPVTGTASGALGAYYHKFISKDQKKSLELIVEQGQEIKKDGKVIVQSEKVDSSIRIKIKGTAVFVNQIEVKL